MFIDDYYDEAEGRLRFSRKQGSDFAKSIASDFNPLHDIDNRRFCIPGDLLFSVLLARYGVSEHLSCKFTDRVPADIELLLPEPSSEVHLCDAQGREYLQVFRSGAESFDTTFIETLSRRYVEFSGYTFPHVLEPLLAEKDVMINLSRPMVMYAGMSIDLDSLDICDPVLRSARSELEVEGRRGQATIGFDILENDEIVGRGRKHILVGGLREYEPGAMAATIAEYDALKQTYLSK